ncbi:YybH family protein [Roseovarius aestuariivivens]|uniref:YybH family protein n=1 Tax=Roseovarius aestuariivivens TaxID=1888910 RepID=UPI001436A42B|nr:DUF4440 domain-containing protein [Roseovarius aestuariivivens]
METMTKSFARICAVLCLLVMIGPQSAVAEDMQAKVAGMNAAWDAAFNAGDAGAIAEMYAEDARVVTGDGMVVDGADNIGALFQKFIDSGFGQHEIVLDTVDGQDGLIYETGSWSGVGADGKTYGGKVVNVYERQDDGAWKTVLHMWN